MTFMNYWIQSGVGKRQVSLDLCLGFLRKGCFTILRYSSNKRSSEGFSVKVWKNKKGIIRC